MKVGIISFAHMHAYSYAQQIINHKDTELTAVWDADSTRGNEAANQFECTYFESLDEFLSSGIDAVIVCSENAKHREHVVAAAMAGKQILCEKPIATEIADAVEMIRVCEQQGVILQIAFPVRFSQTIIQMKHIVQSGKLGKILAINSTNHGKMPGGWFIEKELSGGGAATDHIVHLMDVIRWIFKDEVKRVYAELDTRFYDIDVEDCGIVLLELQSGINVSIDPSWSRPKTFPTWGDVTMEIIGEKGTISVDIFKQSSMFYNDQDQRAELLPWMDDLDEGLVDDFIQTVKKKGKASITGVDGLRTLEVVKAAYAANDTKKFVELKLESV